MKLGILLHYAQIGQVLMIMGILELEQALTLVSINNLANISVTLKNL